MIRKLILGISVVLFCSSLPVISIAEEYDLEFIERAVNTISSEDKQRMREIIAGVMGGDPAFLSNSSRNEFWLIFEKLHDLDGASDDRFYSFMSYVRRAMTGVTTVGMKLFWEDALWAKTSGRFFKSSMRDQLERSYLEQGLVSQSRLDQNDALIMKIAQGEPVATGNGAIVFDEDIIKAALSNVEEAGQRVEWLFSEPNS